MQEQEEDDVSEWSSAWEEFRRAIAAPGRTESLQDLVSRRQLSLAAINDDDDGSDDDDEKEAAQQLGIAYGGLTAAERRDVWAWHVRLSRAEVFGRYYFPEQWEWREMETIRKFLALKDPKEAPEAWVSGSGRLKCVLVRPAFSLTSDRVMLHFVRVRWGKSPRRRPLLPFSSPATSVSWLFTWSC